LHVRSRATLTVGEDVMTTQTDEDGLVDPDLSDIADPTSSITVSVPGLGADLGRDGSDGAR